MRSFRGALVLLAVVFIALVTWRIASRAASPDRRGDPAAPGSVAAAAFVGTATCASCHQAEHAAWLGSHHDRAMQPASPDTVLGDFNGARLTEGAITSRFFQRDGRFFVNTDGADGTLADFEIRYTFGVEPLQQYLIELPGGRVQPLSIAWDARPLAAGGQRWFHLYAGQGIEPGDDLHWTGRLQNWNFMCADCHSTNVRKGYDAQTGTFRTTWSEIDVGCEACHGPGSRHDEWARASTLRRSLFWRDNGLTAQLTERRNVSWDTSTGQPRRSEPRSTELEIQVCAQCHSRRAQIADGLAAGARFEDFYVPDPLVAGLYHADGQQRDEVYTYGSFLQSRMHAAGVTCSDCHEPHSQRLRAEGDRLCVGCHTAPTYAAPAHTLHPSEESRQVGPLERADEPAPASRVAQRRDIPGDGAAPAAPCVSCHMPATTYMVVDPRRDHSFRVPRPDQSAALGVPNACNGCHTDRTPQWAAAAIRSRFGRNPAGFQRFAEAFYEAEQGNASAARTLRAMATDQSQPSIVRASALTRLRDTAGTDAVDAARTALTDPDPSVRWAALALLERLAPDDRPALAAPLLDDPVRSVRIQAAWLLAPAASLLTPDGRGAFDRAAAEFVASQQFNADRVENRRALGTFYAQMNREREAEREFRGAVALAPNDPASHHLLGLSLIRSRNVATAIAELETASRTAPERPEYAYAYAVALNGSGRAGEAIGILEQALARHPRDRELLFALATFNRDRGTLDAASRYAQSLAQAGDARGRALLDSFR